VLGAAKRRLEALEELTKIEIAFASLRDQLFLERIEDVSRERRAIEDGKFLGFFQSFPAPVLNFEETGLHPQLINFASFISSRRAARLDGAAKWLAQLENQYAIKEAAEERAVWSWWSVSIYTCFAFLSVFLES
jgi:hypothetical protein